MVSLRVFLMIVGTLVIRQLSKDLDTYPTEHAAVTMTAYCVLFAVLSKFAAFLAVSHRRDFQAVDALRYFAECRRLLEITWIALMPAALVLSGWSSLIEQSGNSARPHVVMIAGWIAPTLIFLALLDLSEAQLVAHVTELHGRNQKSAGSESIWRLWLQLLRVGPLGGAMMCLMPMLFLIGSLDLLRLFSPSMSTAMQSLCAAMLLGLILVVFAPSWMSLWMGTKRVSDGPVYERVLELCKRMGAAIPRVEFVPGERAWQGAAVVGWTRWNRRLWIGDALVKSLTLSELDMVILHELAHLNRRHSWWRAAPIFAGAAGAALIIATGHGWLSTFDAAFMDSAKRMWLECVLEGSAVCAAVLGMALGLSYAARRCEFDADRRACVLAADNCEWAAGRPYRAAAVLVSALHNLAGSEDEVRRASWLHPAVSHRCEELAVFRR